ncbi:hypothetical protein GPROT1_03076 [Gammaproteobacteria bacterium]|nr:hypothetical protein GPROT1_03076 [Gammaproteobacteria bacterium]
MWHKAILPFKSGLVVLPVNGVFTMSKYLIKVGISHSLESTLVNDLNALANVIYSAGGSVIHLDVKSRARQICVQIEAQDNVIPNLLETKGFNADLIKSIFLIKEGKGVGNGIVEELGFAGFFQGGNINDNLAIQVYPI